MAEQHNMKKALQEFEHLRIELKEIRLATNDFDKNNRIGVGGFGAVYEGEVSHSNSKKPIKAAIKRLNPDPKRGQGKTEFLKEIILLSHYKHENIISLIGFCYEEKEMILVYELATRNSLDKHLRSPELTWARRLQICLDVAKGISYLHDPRDTHQRLVHCDIKSANILLDDHWKAKVADFGLSIKGSANEQQSVIVTTVAGTHGYCDPEYAMTHTLTKESDVYSFGVVLFEVLCGKFCCTFKKNKVYENFVRSWIDAYEQKRLNDIIFKDSTIQPLDQSTLKIFSNIAYKCLNISREKRPTMSEVVAKLEDALETQVLFESQEFSEWKTQLSNYKEITKNAEPPLNYLSEVGFLKLLYKGVVINGGKTFFSLNKKGEHSELISLTECLKLDGSEVEVGVWISKSGIREMSEWTSSTTSRPLDEVEHELERFFSAINSRFHVGALFIINREFKTRVKTQFLSPGITYTVHVVLKIVHEKDGSLKRFEYLGIKYKLQGETEYSESIYVYEREDGWWECELYQLTSDKTSIDLEILFGGFGEEGIVIEGVEFRPLERVEPEVSYNKTLNTQPTPDSDLDSDDMWEEKMPNDYKDIMEMSSNSLPTTTKKEAYSIFRKGFLICNSYQYSLWISIDKNGKKSVIIPPKSLGLHGEPLKSFPGSRFEEIVLSYSSLAIIIYIESYLVSSQMTYAAYLVYKFQEDQGKSTHQGPIEVSDRKKEPSSDNRWYIYLQRPLTPVLKRKADQNTHNPPSRPETRGISQHRNDGWMEVKIWEFRSDTTDDMIHMDFNLSGVSEVIVEGVELRPL